MSRPAPIHCRLALVVLATALACGAASADARWNPPQHGVIGVDDAQLDPDYWVARANDPDRVILDAGAIDGRNERLLHVDATVHDLHGLKARLSRDTVAAWVEALSARPTRPLYDAGGRVLQADRIDALIAALDIPAIPESQATRFGLVVRRAALRTFPTTLRVFSRRGDTDIDRFQETALFPGTAVVIAHESADRQWWFVVSERYAAWVDKSFVAEGSAEQVLGYGERRPYRVVTGAGVATVFTPEQPPLSALHLDMSVRVPLLPDWPAAQPVNGQHAYASYVVDLPLRGDDGKLRFAPALLQKNADTRAGYLPLTRANIVRQAFKFLGERYGWGHSYEGRDCSGFVSDVYRSMGVLMPRNTRDQSVSPGLDHRSFGAADDKPIRLAAVHALDVGDLVYIPGHVMMAIGSVDGEPYVIHDTSGISYRGRDGARVRVDLNQVAVSPLTPLLFDDDESYVDRMTSIVRVRPPSDQQPNSAP